MNTLHGALMVRAVLANCNKQEYFVVEDKDAETGSRLVNKEEYAKIMMAYASFIADKCPQLFSAIPLYLTYVTEAVTDKAVTEFLGQSLQVITSTPSGDEEAYCRQTIAISKQVKLELCYRYDRPVTGTVYHNNESIDKFQVRTMSEVCDIIHRFTGEVVVVEE